MKKKQKIIGAITLIVIIFAICIYKYIEEKPKNLKNEDIFVEEVVKEENSVNKNTKGNKIAVEIKGEVNKPGIYLMSKEAILKDLISESGGATEKADLWNVNGAEVLRSNVSYKIPSKPEGKDSSKTAINMVNNTINSDGKVNINTASEKELDSLPGIGKTLAEQIVSYRTTNGPFRELEDLKKVNKRITTKLIEGIKDKAIVN